MPVQALHATILPDPLRAALGAAVDQINALVLGKPREVRLAFATLLAGGHLLVEDLPGLGKTTLARALAATLGLDFQRMQFTSDLLPSDILGVSIFDPNARGAWSRLWLDLAHEAFNQGNVTLSTEFLGPEEMQADLQASGLFAREPWPIARPPCSRPSSSPRSSPTRGSAAATSPSSSRPTPRPRSPPRGPASS